MLRILIASITLALASGAHAETPLKTGEIRIQIAGQAAREIANDLLTVTLSAEKEAPTRAQAYAAGVAASQKGNETFRQTPSIQVRASQFAIHPVFDKSGSERAFRARYSIRLESRDFPALLKLLGSVADQYMVETLNFQVSPELRRSTEAQLMAEVVKDVRAKAALLQGELGVARLQLAEIDYAPSLSPMPLRPAPLAMRATSAAAADALAADSGISRIEIGARAVLRGQ